MDNFGKLQKIRKKARRITQLALRITQLARRITQLARRITQLARRITQLAQSAAANSICTLPLHDQFSIRHQVDVIYFDFSKAFDTLNHSILAEKLAKYFMPFFIFFATMNFVINRKYHLKVNGQVMPHSFSTYSAVPEGSRCGSE